MRELTSAKAGSGARIVRLAMPPAWPGHRGAGGFDLDQSARRQIKDSPAAYCRPVFGGDANGTEGSLSS
jgi:hypothetical protein